MTLEERVMRILKDNYMDQYGVDVSWNRGKSDAENTANIVKSLLIPRCSMTDMN